MPNTRKLTRQHKIIATAGVAAAVIALSVAFATANASQRGTQRTGPPVPTPSRHGTWQTAPNGAVYTTGDAHNYGSMRGRHLNAPIVGLTPTKTGHGYWLTGADGGVFNFGDAKFYGSTGALRLNGPIIGLISAARTGHANAGYWLVAQDGGVFTFGNARFYGSAGALGINNIVRARVSPTGNGYTLIAGDGRTYTYGDAPTPNAAPGARAADLFNRLNAERVARGENALAWNPQLAGYAAAWSRLVGTYGHLFHSNIGQLLGPYDYVGENIAGGSAGVSAGALHVAWMHSPEHRDNMLSPGFQQAGVGVFCAPDGSIWATTEFGRPASAGPAPAYNGGTSEQPIVRPGSDSVRCPA